MRITSFIRLILLSSMLPTGVIISSNEVNEVNKIIRKVD